MIQGNYPNSFNITHKPNNTDYRNLIIQPAENKMEKSRRTYILLLDSRDRNTTKFPNPAQYTLDLKTPYKDIIEVELLSAFVPKSEYTITQDVNDTLYIKMGNNAPVYNTSDNIIVDMNNKYLAIPPENNNNILSVVIPPGIYTRDSTNSLRNALETALNNHPNLSDFVVEYDTLTDKYTINNTANTEFQLFFYARDENHGSYEYIKDSNFTYPLKDINFNVVTKFNSFQERLAYMKKIDATTDGNTGSSITINGSNNTAEKKNASIQINHWEN